MIVGCESRPLRDGGSGPQSRDRVITPALLALCVCLRSVLLEVSIPWPKREQEAASSARRLPKLAPAFRSVVRLPGARAGLSVWSIRYSSAASRVGRAMPDAPESTKQESTRPRAAPP
jgi:hypothetical protein